MKIEITHRFSSVVLFSIECDSWCLAVEAAVKTGANLGGANLRGATLGGANLGGAKVLGVVTIGCIDGWLTMLWHTDQGYFIQAGCHTFTLDEAKAHYADRTTRQGLYYLATEAWQAIARLQGWTEARG